MITTLFYMTYNNGDKKYEIKRKWILSFFSRDTLEKFKQRFEKRLQKKYNHNDIQVMFHSVEGDKPMQSQWFKRMCRDLDKELAK